MLNVEKLRIEFDGDDGPVSVVEDFSFRIAPGEVVGLVGESGCGKSVTALSLMRLLPTPGSRISADRMEFRGENILAMKPARLRALRGAEMAMVFQDPMSALSPLWRVGDQLVECRQLHRRIARAEAWNIGVEWLRRVGLADPEECMRRYPHQLSGGMRQRVMLAAALQMEPALLIADEPTTALDVTVQAQIFDILLEQKSRQTAVLLITHDLGVVWDVCERVLVMYAGRLAEAAPRAALFAEPRHPYTQGLLRSLPGRQVPGARLEAIPGQVPAPRDYPAGCRFRDRCPRAFAACAAVPPVTACGADHTVACFYAAANP